MKPVPRTDLLPATSPPSAPAIAHSTVKLKIILALEGLDNSGMVSEDSLVEPGPSLQSQKRKRSAESLLLNHPEVVQVKKRLNLQISIPVDTIESGEHSASSLFSSVSDPLHVSPVGASNSSPPLAEIAMSVPATRTSPPIPGLFFDPSLLIPPEVADTVVKFCLDSYFTSPNVNQIMLFERAPSSCSSSNPADRVITSGLPPPLTGLLTALSKVLSPSLPPSIHTLLFPQRPTRARQVIINLYHPGEGITPHVDLLRRFGDGIIGVSFSSGCVMQFVRQETPPEAGKECVDANGRRNVEEDPQSLHGSSNNLSVHDVYLPERSVIVMTGEARYRWTHGIARRIRDYVSSKGKLDHDVGTWIDRKVRLSVTFRWLLPGAEVVGSDSLDLEE